MTYGAVAGLGILVGLVVVLVLQRPKRNRFGAGTRGVLSTRRYLANYAS